MRPVTGLPRRRVRQRDLPGSPIAPGLHSPARTVPGWPTTPARFCSATRVCSRIDPPTGVPFKIGPWPARNASLPPAMTASENAAPADRAARRPVIIGYALVPTAPATTTSVTSCRPPRWLTPGPTGISIMKTRWPARQRLRLGLRRSGNPGSRPVDLPPSPATPGCVWLGTGRVDITHPRPGIAIEIT